MASPAATPLIRLAIIQPQPRSMQQGNANSQQPCSARETIDRWEIKGFSVESSADYRCQY